MNTVLTVIAIILAVLVVLLAVLYFLGKKAEKKQAEQKAAMDAMAQTMSLYIIDKKRMRLKDANLPKAVEEATPKYMRRAKLPIVKVKAGSRVMSLIADEKVFTQLLPAQEVKATISGIYITGAKRIRGPVPEAPKKKKLSDHLPFKKKDEAAKKDTSPKKSNSKKTAEKKN